MMAEEAALNFADFYDAELALHNAHFGSPPRSGGLIVFSISVAAPDKPHVTPLALPKQDGRTG